MITRILAALALAALSFPSAAHNEYSVGSTEIELYELEMSPNETIKLKHLKSKPMTMKTLLTTPCLPRHKINNRSHDLSQTPV